MTDSDDLREADFEQAASQLNEGLRSCRSLLANYRSVLAGDAGDGALPTGADGAALDGSRAVDERDELN